ncbi:hypothetical protein PHLCEN_2v11324 [Hermanssonia centrifuga]|uniref:Uncharacterized protein n=1 Tax=Hermanssonia centrifuga TaxID=98765 RepID=A0A2R6NKD5_9APHY|nr:hypothetical protein PHLCEN_2v11324 [Hermanssonia centrifuga]
MSRSPTDSMRMVAIAPDVPGSVPYGMNGDFSRMSIISSPEASKSSPLDSGVAFVKGGKRKRLSKLLAVTAILLQRSVHTRTRAVAPFQHLEIPTLTGPQLL